MELDQDMDTFILNIKCISVMDGGSYDGWSQKHHLWLFKYRKCKIFAKYGIQESSDRNHGNS